MKSAIAIAASFLVLAGLANAQPVAQGSPLALKLVSKVDKEKGDVIFIVTVTKVVPVFVEKVVVVNGREMTVRETVYQTVLEKRTEIVQPAQGRVITPDGKQLPIDEVWKRVRPNTVVAVSGDGSTPAAAYLRALNPETLVLIPGQPAPPPVPKQP